MVTPRSTRGPLERLDQFELVDADQHSQRRLRSPRLPLLGAFADRSKLRRRRVLLGCCW
jgi:hypothetical protein